MATCQSVCSRSDWQHQPDMSKACIFPRWRGPEAGGNDIFDMDAMILLAETAALKAFMWKRFEAVNQ